MCVYTSYHIMCMYIMYLFGVLPGTLVPVVVLPLSCAILLSPLPLFPIPSRQSPLSLTSRAHFSKARLHFTLHTLCYVSRTHIHTHSLTHCPVEYRTKFCCRPSSVRVYIICIYDVYNAIRLDRMVYCFLNIVL